MNIRRPLVNFLPSWYPTRVGTEAPTSTPLSANNVDVNTTRHCASERRTNSTQLG